MPDAQQTADVADKHTPICAIGASAGGVVGLKTFFRELGDDLGLAYVVIMHLAPDHPSLLDEILTTCTTMPVCQVQDSPRLQPNRVYVIPPDRELVIRGDDVLARPFTEARGRRAPIDLFFRSVAVARADGIAVVLSGAGSDGAAGVRAIKEAGGVVCIQDPAEAEHPNMPNSAIATGVADVVAPIPELVRRITEIMHSKAAVQILLENNANKEHLRAILNTLRARTGHDFSSYKKATVLRRVSRRMQMTQRIGMEQYIDYLRESPEEAKRLFSDLLISVTMFFRDPGAFRILADEAIRPLFDDPSEGGVRAWVAGCATGEEAYSLAILLLEEAARRQVFMPIHIFATDLDEGALATAREGRYPTSIEADVSEERLRRFFIKEGTHYRVRKEVRDVVLFAAHSVLKDPPFMRLQLITCRNLMIYLERNLQRQLFALFHYGLHPNGLLFLGSAETVDATPDLFTSISREARLYRARSEERRRLPLLPQVRREHPASAAPGHQPAMPPGRRDDDCTRTHVAALEQHAPPSVLVDREYRAVHLSPSAGRFLLPSGGAFTADLLALVRPELRGDLIVALQHAFERKAPTLTPPVAVTFNGHHHKVMMAVAPVSSREEGGAQQALVLFLDGGVMDTSKASTNGASAEQADDIRRLREQLRASEERLRISHAEHDLSIQDLRAANEELQSLNEEYRSTSEELETSKEELQSMNEELQTVNAELKSKLENVSSAHSDLRNLVAATEIGTLFLDRELAIRMFTPRVADLFNITEGDIGRPITDFTHRLNYDRLKPDAEQVMRALIPLEKEVEATNGCFLIMGIRPYRTVEDRIDGVVVTFVDVTERREAAVHLRASEEKYRSLFESINDGLLRARIVWDEDGKPVDAVYSEGNPAAIRMVKADFLGRRLTEVAPGFEPHWWEIPARVLATGEPEQHELSAAPLGQWFDVYAWKVRPEDDSVAILFRDVTERRRQLDELSAAREAEAANLAKSRFLASVSHDLRQPVMAANLFMEALKLRPLEPDERKLVDLLAQSLTSLNGMLTGLLQVARLDAGIIQPEIEDFPLDELLGRLHDEFDVVARASHLSLDIPPTGVALRSDPLLVELVLRNLLSNAIKFTVDGGIRVEVAAARGSARISVVDTGVGIPVDELGRVFGDYVQLGKTARDHSRGFGIGLSTVRRVADLLGITVRVNSEVGRGSTFTFILPLAKAGPGGVRKSVDAVGDGVLDGVTVLVVDDEVLVLKALELSLQSLGATVLTARNLRGVATALEQASNPPDAIIADYSLAQNECGTEAIALARGRGVKVAVLLTGDTAPERMAEAQRSGYRLLHKPMDTDRLAKLLSGLLSQG
jgi:two-component system CheB/CheR fusion protein